MKQPMLRPQDIVVCLKLCLKNAYTTTQDISSSLYISVGEVHSALKRAERSRLIISEGRSKRVLRAAFLEFVLHGLKYTFPATIGTITRGMPTGIAAVQDVERRFVPTEALPYVWPHPEGRLTGIALTPLFPSVPKAAAFDPELYRGLALIDAIREGAAREREFASHEIRLMLAK